MVPFWREKHKKSVRFLIIRLEIPIFALDFDKLAYNR